MDLSLPFLALAYHILSCLFQTLRIFYQISSPPLLPELLIKFVHRLSLKLLVVHGEGYLQGTK